MQADEDSSKESKECKKAPIQKLGMKVPNATPIIANYHMAVNLDTDHEDTSASYKASEDDDIYLLGCNQVSVELKEDKVGVIYVY